MAIVKYEKQEVMAIVILVLNYMSCNLTTSIFKVALDGEFSDLKGLVDPENMDQVMSDMTQRLDDPMSVVLRELSEQIMTLYDNLALIHAIDLMELFEDERLAEIATDMYWTRSFYKNEESDDNLGDLDLFMYSLPIVIDQLQEFIIEEQYDPQADCDWDFKGAEYFENLQNSEIPAVRELGELGTSVYDYHERIIAIINAD